MRRFGCQLALLVALMLASMVFGIAIMLIVYP